MLVHMHGMGEQKIETNRNKEEWRKRKANEQIGSSRRYLVYVIIIMDNRTTDINLSTPR